MGRRRGSTDVAGGIGANISGGGLRAISLSKGLGCSSMTGCSGVAVSAPECDDEGFSSRDTGSKGSYASNEAL
jgi:hypothetical protein